MMAPRGRDQAASALAVSGTPAPVASRLERLRRHRENIRRCARELGVDLLNGSSGPCIGSSSSFSAPPHHCDGVARTRIGPTAASGGSGGPMPLAAAAATAAADADAVVRGPRAEQQRFEESARRCLGDEGEKSSHCGMRSVGSVSLKTEERTAAIGDGSMRRGAEPPSMIDDIFDVIQYYRDDHEPRPLPTPVAAPSLSGLAAESEEVDTTTAVADVSVDVEALCATSGSTSSAAFSATSASEALRVTGTQSSLGHELSGAEGPSSSHVVVEARGALAAGAASGSCDRACAVLSSPSAPPEAAGMEHKDFTFGDILERWRQQYSDLQRAVGEVSGNPGTQTQAPGGSPMKVGALPDGDPDAFLQQIKRELGIDADPCGMGRPSDAGSPGLPLVAEGLFDVEGSSPRSSWRPTGFGHGASGEQRSSIPAAQSASWMECLVEPRSSAVQAVDPGSSCIDLSPLRGGVDGGHGSLAGVECADVSRFCEGLSRFAVGSSVPGVGSGPGRLWCSGVGLDSIKPLPHSCAADDGAAPERVCRGVESPAANNALLGTGAEQGGGSIASAAGARPEAEAADSQEDLRSRVRALERELSRVRSEHAASKREGVAGVAEKNSYPSSPLKCPVEEPLDQLRNSLTMSLVSSSASVWNEAAFTAATLRIPASAEPSEQAAQARCADPEASPTLADRSDIRESASHVPPERPVAEVRAIEVDLPSAMSPRVSPQSAEVEPAAQSCCDRSDGVAVAFPSPTDVGVRPAVSAEIPSGPADESAGPASSSSSDPARERDAVPHLNAAAVEKAASASPPETASEHGVTTPVADCGLNKSAMDAVFRWHPLDPMAPVDVAAPAAAAKPPLPDQKGTKFHAASTQTSPWRRGEELPRPHSTAADGDRTLRDARPSPFQGVSTPAPQDAWEASGEPYFASGGRQPGCLPGFGRGPATWAQPLGRAPEWPQTSLDSSCGRGWLPPSLPAGGPYLSSASRSSAPLSHPVNTFGLEGLTSLPVGPTPFSPQVAAPSAVLRPGGVAGREDLLACNTSRGGAAACATRGVTDDELLMRTYEVYRKQQLDLMR